MKRTALHKNGKTIHRDKGQFCQQMICRQLEIYICKKWIDRYLTSCIKSNANRLKTLFTTIKIGNVNLPTSIHQKKYVSTTKYHSVIKGIKNWNMLFHGWISKHAKRKKADVNNAKGKKVDWPWNTEVVLGLGTAYKDVRKIMEIKKF